MYSPVGNENILNDTLFEMGYGEDSRLVKALMKRNVIDFSYVDSTKDILYQLEDHYGERVWGELRHILALEEEEERAKKKCRAVF